MQTFLWDTLEAAGIAFNALKANKIRSLLSTLGITIGIMTVIFMVTIVSGLNQSVKNLLASMGTGTLFIQSYSWTSPEDFSKWPRINLNDYQAVLRQSQLAETVSPFISIDRPVAYKSTVMKNVQLIGTSETYMSTMDLLPEIGRFISASDVASHREVAVIGSEVADKLFSRYHPLGQNIRIGDQPYKVIGVLEKKGSVIGQSLDNNVIIPLGSVLKRFGRKFDVAIIAKSANLEQIEDLREELRGILRKSRHLTPREKDNFAINEPEQIMKVYRDATTAIYTAGIAIGGMALLVAGIGIMNIMLVSVTERTHEIGIRKALGARNSQIMRQFLIESALICSVGGIMGIGAAWVGGKLITTWLPIAMPFYVVVGGFFFASTVGLFFGLYPAAKAAHLDPIEALRRE